MVKVRERYDAAALNLGRLGMGLSVRELARRSGLARGSVVNAMQGKATPKTVHRICAVLGMSARGLYAAAQGMPAAQGNEEKAAHGKAERTEAQPD